MYRHVRARQPSVHVLAPRRADQALYALLRVRARHSRVAETAGVRGTAALERSASLLCSERRCNAFQRCMCRFKV